MRPLVRLASLVLALALAGLPAAARAASSSAVFRLSAANATTGAPAQ